MAERVHRLLQAQALRQQLAHLAVARQIAGGGQHQIAQARQTHEGVHPRTERQAEPGHLRKPTGNQRCAGVQAQAQAVAQAGGNGQHVFDRATHLHTHQVFVGVHAQCGAVKSRHQDRAHAGVFAGGHQGGGLAARHFLRKAGAAEHAGVQLRRHMGAYFVAHEPGQRRAFARTSGSLRSLKAFAQPSHWGRVVLQALQHAAQPRHGRGHHQQVGTVHGRLGCVQVGTRNVQRVGQGQAWQIAAVFALRLHVGGLRGVARPQRDAVCVRRRARRADGQGRAPGTGPQHSNVQRCRAHKRLIA